jgi:uncharacterized protein
LRAVVLSGGPTHDFPATTSCLTALLAEQSIDAGVHTDVEAAFGALPGAGLLVVNALRWTMASAGTPDRYREHAGAEGVSPSAAARQALARHLRDGGGVLALHTAIICFDDWPEWGEALGGRWIWGRSNHPPLGPPVPVTVTDRHPLTDGVGGFTIMDEVYGDLELRPEVTGLLSAAQPGRPESACPLLWTRQFGGGRVVYDMLGHHPASYEVPAHREIVRRAIRWTAGG